MPRHWFADTILPEISGPNGEDLRMANPEHLDKLLQALAAGDISIWNAWRKQQIGRWQPDLSDASLSHANLVGADLSNAVLTHADLSQARLTKADLSYADLRNAQLSSADLSGADMYSARAQGSNLAQSDLSFARLGLRSWEDRTLWMYAGLQDANLSEAQLRWTDLSWVDLSRANL